MISSRSMLILFAAQMAVVAAGPSARAEIISFALDTTTNGETPELVDPSKPFLTLTFEDTATDQVTMTFDATNLQSSNFITDVYFNLNPAIIGPLDVLVFPGNGGSFQSGNPPTILPGFVSFNAQTGLFSLRFSFNLDPTTSDAFSGGETTTAVLGRSGLRASDFIATSIDKPAPDPATGGWYASAQVRGIQLPGGREGRGFVGTKTFTVVPEPSSFALAGIGGLALGGMMFRRKRKQGRSDA